MVIRRFLYGNTPCGQRVDNMAREIKEIPLTEMNAALKNMTQWFMMYWTMQSLRNASFPIHIMFNHFKRTKCGLHTESITVSMHIK